MRFRARAPCCSGLFYGIWPAARCCAGVPGAAAGGATPADAEGRSCGHHAGSERPWLFRAALARRAPAPSSRGRGIIDLKRQTISIDEPFLTIAARRSSPNHDHPRLHRHQDPRLDRAPHPIRTGVDGQARGRVGKPTPCHGRRPRLIVDHCTMTWALDENLSASGPRFTGRHAGRMGRARRAGSLSPTYPAKESPTRAIPRASIARARSSTQRHRDLIYRNSTPIITSATDDEGRRQSRSSQLIYNPAAGVHYNLMALEWAGHPYSPRAERRGQRPSRRSLDRTLAS